ncbi:MAG: FAD-binding oxidoreductase [Pirellulaceae bacterium]
MDSKPMTPSSVDEVRDLVKQFAHQGNQRPYLLPVGSGSKTGLSDWSPILPDQLGRKIERISTSRLQGVIDYNPADFTITAYAGTTIADLQSVLDEHRQFLPFDPVFVSRGATLGGTIASGVNGPCRMLWGGIRDFVLAVEFVDGTGESITAGARVVKNTAGFDLPKFFVGSAGRFGILTSITMKVFPKPRGYATLHLPCKDWREAMSSRTQIMHSPLEIVGVELLSDATLLVRFAGEPKACMAMAKRAAELAGNANGQILDGVQEVMLWDELRDLVTAPAHHLIRLATRPGSIVRIERKLQEWEVGYRRVGHGGNSVWLEWPCQRSLGPLGEYCKEKSHPIAGTIILGPALSPWVGCSGDRVYWELIQKALDPNQCFLPI